MSGAVWRYRVLAITVSVLLVVLVFLGVPLKYAGDHPGVAKWVGLAHGVLFYPAFLLTVVDLGWRTRMPFKRLVLTMLLGTVPIASFFAERATMTWLGARNAAAAERSADVGVA